MNWYFIKHEDTQTSFENLVKALFSTIYENYFIGYLCIYFLW